MRHSDLTSSPGPCVHSWRELRVGTESSPLSLSLSFCLFFSLFLSFLLFFSLFPFLSLSSYSPSFSLSPPPHLSFPFLALLLSFLHIPFYYKLAHLHWGLTKTQVLDPVGYLLWRPRTCRGTQRGLGFIVESLSTPDGRCTFEERDLMAADWGWRSFWSTIGPWCQVRGPCLELVFRPQGSAAAEEDPWGPHTLRPPWVLLSTGLHLFHQFSQVLPF